MANSVLLISIVLTALAEALRIDPDSGGGVPMSLYEAPKTRSGTRYQTPQNTDAFLL